MEQKYIDAINSVNNAIKNDNKEIWWPNIIRIEGNSKIHLIDGIEACSTDSDNDSHTNSLLRLKDKPCAIFAYDIKYGIQLSDILVGFMSNDKTFLKMAWDNSSRVFPMIGQISGKDNQGTYIQWDCKTFINVPEPPKNTKWIIAASLNTEYREAVNLFGRDKTLEELKNYTPVF
jgi:hypothetical protein